MGQVWSSDYRNEKKWGTYVYSHAPNGIAQTHNFAYTHTGHREKNVVSLQINIRKGISIPFKLSHSLSVWRYPTDHQIDWIKYISGGEYAEKNEEKNNTHECWLRLTGSHNVRYKSLLMRLSYRTNALRSLSLLLLLFERILYENKKQKNRYWQIWKFYERIILDRKKRNVYAFIFIFFLFILNHTHRMRFLIVCFQLLVQFGMMINYGHISVTCSNLIMNIICSCVPFRW